MEPEQPYPPPQDGALLAPTNGAHVFVFSLDVAEDLHETLHGLLSVEERSRADRYVFPLHRSRYIVGRGRMRLLLARYCAVAPEMMTLEEGVHGKPALTGPTAPTFNLSHTGGLAALAVTAAGPIGVDIERVGAVEAGLEDTVSTPEECATFARLGAAEREACFYRLWTCKEAVLKALGTGFSMSPLALAVNLEPTDPPGVVWLGGDDAARDRWRLHQFAPAPGVVGALAVATQAPLAVSVSTPWGG
jgi:4'-phosphopantetheinyl transferase